MADAVADAVVADACHMVRQHAGTESREKGTWSSYSNAS